MYIGITALIAAYVLSQFYRAFLAVLAPILEQELHASAAELAAASGYWFLAFSIMQLPVGWLLDRAGPRRTASLLLAFGGGGGAALFATAQSAHTISIAMALIGIGCAPVLMSSYYIFARTFSPAVFATFAGVSVGIGNIGNIVSSTPLSYAVDTFGWRPSIAGLGVLTALIAALIGWKVRDVPSTPHLGTGKLSDLLKMPAIWPIFIMIAVCYAPAASIRGLWIGPYYRDVFGADTAFIGQAGLIMGIAMVIGSFAYGPMERLLRSRKKVILGGNVLTLACITALALFPETSRWGSAALLFGIGFFGSSFPIVVAHGRAFIPHHLTGRGVTLLNLFCIAPAGLLQFATGAVYGAFPAPPASAPYVAIFTFIAVLLALGLMCYTFARDRTD